MSLVVGPMAWAESVEPRSNLGNTATRLRGAVTILPVPWGLIALGGSRLRQLPKGKTEWETLHRVEGGNLYRIAGDDRGRLLAAWESEEKFHLFVPRTKEHLTFPMPTKPGPEFRSFYVGDLYFSSDGTGAIVFMRGQTGNSVSTTVAYHQPFDGNEPPTVLFRQTGHQLHTTPRAALFATSSNDRMPCDNNGCFPLSSVIAWEITGRSARSRTLIEGKGDELSIARMVWGGDDEHFALVIHGNKNQRTLLRWSVGEEKASEASLTKGPGYQTEEMRLLKSGVVLELWRSKEGLLLKRYTSEGWVKSTTLARLGQSDPDIAPDDRVHAIRERKNGDLLLHWGNHLVLMSADGKPERVLDIEPLLKRRNEWASADTYVADPEALWIGIEIGAGRDFVYLPFADIEKRAAAWKNEAASSSR